MRIFRRDAFMKLPAGTIYAKGKPWYFESLEIKGATISHDGRDIDWASLSPVWISAPDSGAAVDQLDQMLNGASYPMEEAYGRDGCFDDDELFLVFERADLVNLRAMIDHAIEVSDA